MFRKEKDIPFGGTQYVVNGFVKTFENGKLRRTCLIFSSKEKSEEKYLLYFDDLDLVLTDYFSKEELLNCLDKAYDFKFYKPVGYMEFNFKTDKNDNPYSDVFDTNKENIILKDPERFLEISEETFFGKLEKLIWVPDEVIVHSGRMHADDVFSVALLKYINNDIKVIRTRDIPSDFKGLVVDVGDGRYDHHGLDKVRYNKGEELVMPNGQKEVYAAFGLLAKDILPGLVGTGGYFAIDHKIIRSLDSNDNYGVPSDLAAVFAVLNPFWDEDTPQDEAFDNAVNIAYLFIDRLVKNELAKQKAIPVIKKAIEESKNNILVLDRAMPWSNYVKKSRILYVIFKTDEGTYALQAVPSITADSFHQNFKRLLPKSWLENMPKGCITVHSQLHIAFFDTKENALAAANYLVNNRIGAKK